MHFQISTFLIFSDSCNLCTFLLVSLIQPPHISFKQIHSDYIDKKHSNSKVVTCDKLLHNSIQPTAISIPHNFRLCLIKKIKKNHKICAMDRLSTIVTYASIVSQLSLHTLIIATLFFINCYIYPCNATNQDFLEQTNLNPYKFLKQEQIHPDLTTELKNQIYTLREAHNCESSINQLRDEFQIEITDEIQKFQSFHCYKKCKRKFRKSIIHDHIAACWLYKPRTHQIQCRCIVKTINGNQIHWKYGGIKIHVKTQKIELN